MNIRPMGDRIAVKPDPAEQTTSSGLIITAKAGNAADSGTVLAVGPDATEFNVGDKVIYVKGTGQSVKLEDQDIQMLKTPEVIGITNDKLQSVRDTIVCTSTDMGDQETAAGIIIKSNIDTSQGITSRWMQVYSIGPDVNFLNVGDWVLVEYGRWTESFKVDDHDEAYRVDPTGCMAVSDEKPETLYYNSDVVMTEKKTLY